MIRLHLGDRETARDLTSFLRRARAVNDDGARLTLTPTGTGARLDVCVPILVRAGLLESTPEVFAVRSWALPRAESALDAVYGHAALLDRLERNGGVTWPVPPAEIHRAWAGQAIPTSGWRAAGHLSSKALLDADRDGSAQIAQSLPGDPGQAMVNQARRAVWGASDPALGGLPAGVGFAASRMGFLGRPGSSPETVPVYRREGHVLVAAPHGSVVVRIPGLAG